MNFRYSVIQKIINNTSKALIHKVKIQLKFSKNKNFPSPNSRAKNPRAAKKNHLNLKQHSPKPSQPSSHEINTNNQHFGRVDLNKFAGGKNRRRFVGCP